VPPSASLLRSILDPVPPSKQELFEWGLQLRMTQMALVEVRQGAEGAEEGWLEVFSWVAEKGLGLGGTGGASGGGGSAEDRKSQFAASHFLYILTCNTPFFVSSSSSSCC
jgi:hypothetical protein